MSEGAPVGYYSVQTAKTPLSAKVWRWFGFRDTPIIEHEWPDDAPPHWARTETFVYVSAADRLRLLLSGRMAVFCEHRTDQPVSMQSVCAVSVRPLGTPKLCAW